MLYYQANLQVNLQDFLVFVMLGSPLLIVSNFTSRKFISVLVTENITNIIVSFMAEIVC